LLIDGFLGCHAPRSDQSAIGHEPGDYDYNAFGPNDR
jgi:hypothetical protein